MNIGFDAKRFFHNRTGLGNYSRTLVQNLAAHYPDHQYHLFTPSLPAGAAPLPGNIKIHQPQWGGRFFWRSFGIWQDLAASGLQLYHGLSNELPFTFPRAGIPGIVTIHDLIFKYFPLQYGTLDRNIYDMKSRLSCKTADRIIATSESTKADIVRFYKTDPAKITVIYQGCSPVFYEKTSELFRNSILKKYRIPADFILYVGSVIERKRLLTVVKALQILKGRQEIPLVVVGRGQKQYLQKVRDFVLKYNLTGQVYFLHDVPASDLPALYQQAAAFVYPSVYEGFGIPVLEAIASQTPVITGNRSSLPEVGGPYSRYVDPDNPEELAHAIENTFSDSAATKESVSKSLNFAKKFQPSQLTKQLLSLYLEITKERLK
ncbi:MAG: glycosyltransferase family 1 protein [Bacteroidia bacterium]